jgi:hypothetical protein
MIILDTDHISALQHRDTPQAFAWQARLETFSPDEIATTAITLEEQTRGWLGLIRRYPDVHRQVAYYEGRSSGGKYTAVQYRWLSRPSGASLFSSLL